MSTRIAQLSAQVVPILKKHNVRKASLFGSVLRSDFRQNESDYDFLVEFPEKNTLFDQLRLQVELEKTLHRSVDLVEFSTLNKRIKSHVLDTAVAIL